MRLSSVSYPQSNGRAELGVKAAKRIIHNNIASDGSLNTDNAARAIITYRNTPLPDLQLSPAQILLHRNLKDGIPAHPSHYQMHKSWIISAETRELAYASRNKRLTENYNAHARELPPLTVGTQVLVQNLKKGKRWDKRGRIVEVLPNRQYHICMYPSGRITLQNRRFIRVCTDTDSGNTAIFPSPSLPKSTSTPPVLPSTTIPPLLSPPTNATTNNNTQVPDGHNIPVTLPTLSAPSSTQTIAPQDITSELSISQAAPPKVPRALRNLMTHNNPGLKESPHGDRR